MFNFIQHLLLVTQRILGFLLGWLPFIQRRRAFEAYNRSDIHSRPWARGDQVFWAFHCSSEGEFEQIRPLMLMCLQRQHKLELIYTSPSVERRAQAFARENPAQVRLLRLPLVTSPDLESWSKAHTLIMCRYDFFPALMVLTVKRRVLLWGSLKGKNLTPWQRARYNNFDLVVAATTREAERFKALSLKARLEVYDFRPLQIRTRLQQAQLSPLLAQALALTSPHQRLLLGSAWPHDFFVLQEVLGLAQPIHVWIAPHALDAISLSELGQQWQKMYPHTLLLRWGREASESEVQQLIAAARDFAGPVVWVLEQPGRLLELYPQFNCAYVGGGFGRSIHSVLEPLLAGCWTICGPKTHRSTEVDLGEELLPGQLTVVTNASEFTQAWQAYHQRANTLEDDNRMRASHNWVERGTVIAGRVLAH